ncbi:MAG: carboxypeptidase-like regulatory domain-containing protein, partial [Mucilaginibacter sp.]
MKKLLPCLLLIVLGLPACRKSNTGENHIPNPKTDTLTVAHPTGDTVISGKVGPLDLAGQSTVTLMNLADYSRNTATPDAAGGFKFQALPPGDYDLTVTVPDHADAEITPIKLSARQTIDLETITFVDAGFSITGTGSITGTISPATGVSRVAVLETTGIHRYNGSIGAYGGTIDEGGNFVINNLPEGTFKIYLTPADHYSGYNDVPDVKLERGESRNSGAFLFYDDHNPASPYYTFYEVNGVNRYKEKAVGASYSAPQLHLYTHTDVVAGVPGSGIAQTVTRDGLDLFLDDVTGPGTY